MGLAWRDEVEDVAGVSVRMQVLLLDGQALCYIGGASSPRLDTLAAATPTRFSPVPSTTALLSQGAPDSSDACSRMAARISQKAGRMIFLSYNLTPADAAKVNASPEMLEAAVERRVLDALNAARAAVPAAPVDQPPL